MKTVSTHTRSLPLAPDATPSVVDPFAIAESDELGRDLVQAERAKQIEIDREEQARLEAFSKRLADLD